MPLFLLKEKEIPVMKAIRTVHRIAVGHRRSRLGLDRSLYNRRSDESGADDSSERDAHQMIEEIMIMANHLVAKYLLRKFPEFTPLLVQPPPKIRHVVDWRQRFERFLSLSLEFEWLRVAEIAPEGNVELKVPSQTWNEIMKNVKQGSNFHKLVKIMCDLDLFPQLSLANMHQKQLQQRSRYIHSGQTFEGIPFPWVPNEADLNFVMHGHNSLCLEAYCHFTSPIRRYIDIIVHRLVVATIEGTENTIDLNDIPTICDRCTFLSRNYGRFDIDARRLKFAVELQSSSRFVSAYIDEAALDELKLFFGPGELELIRNKSVRTARLGPDKNPQEVDDHIKLEWEFRLLCIDKQGVAQPGMYLSEDKALQDLPKELDKQYEGKCG